MNFVYLYNYSILYEVNYIVSGDALSSHNAQRFHTRDNDIYAYSYNNWNRWYCASANGGGWWYSGDACGYVNLNGDYDTLSWDHDENPLGTIKFVQMMIKPESTVSLVTTEEDMGVGITSPDFSAIEGKYYNYEKTV